MRDLPESSILEFIDQDVSVDKLDSSILNELDAFIFIVDAQLMIPIWLNSFFYRKMGYSPMDLKKLTTEQFFSMFHPKSLTTFKQNMSEIGGEKRRQRNIYQVKTKNDQWIYMLIRSQVFKRKEDGTPNLVLGFGTEIEKAELSRQMKQIKCLNDKSLENILVKRLSNRELDVIKLIAKGLTDKEISEKLDISIHTTKTHRKRVLSKLGLKNTAALVRFAIENNLA